MRKNRDQGETHMSGEQPMIKLVITDLDDTLWRWPLIYVEPYRRMLRALSADLDLSFDQLVKEVKEVHVGYHDTEYPLSILELPSIQALYPASSIAQRYESLKKYIDIFDQTYTENLEPSLFHPVHDTLQTFREAGIKLVGYTDANSCAITKRMADFDLAKFYDKIYCRGEHVLNGEMYAPWHIARAAVGDHRLTVVDKTLSKPQAQVLARILADVNAGLAANDQILPSEVVYIGDSLERDMRMVQNFNDTLPDDVFGMIAVHAAYGRKDDAICQQYLKGITRAALMPFMQDISYWSADQYAREMHSEREHHAIERAYTLDSHFGELLELEPVAMTLAQVTATQMADAALAVGTGRGLYYASEQQQVCNAPLLTASVGATFPALKPRK